MARADGTAEMLVLAFAPAAAALAAESAERASGLLAELEQTKGAHEVIYYARLLPTMVRTALATGDPAVAKRLAEGLRLRYPLDEHALCAARAQLAEHTGDHAEAATLYAEAAERWHEFGNASQSTPTPSSARAVAWSLSRTPPPSSRSGRRRSCSARWATTPRSWKPRRC
jgi:hypothetical protein